MKSAFVGTEGGCRQRGGGTLEFGRGEWEVLFWRWWWSSESHLLTLIASLLSFTHLSFKYPPLRFTTMPWIPRATPYPSLTRLHHPLIHALRFGADDMSLLLHLSRFFLIIILSPLSWSRGSWLWRQQINLIPPLLLPPPLLRFRELSFT